MQKISIAIVARSSLRCCKIKALKKKMHFLQKISCLFWEFCELLRPQPLLYDSFVYRLGLQVFILARRVQLPYESPFFLQDLSGETSQIEHNHRSSVVFL